MTSLMQALKKRMSPSTQKSINNLRYVAHLAQVRLSNRILPHRTRLRRELGAMNQVQLHWGCGPRRLEGWVNLDGWSSEATDYVHDLRTKLPFADGSVTRIFTEHVLEHLEFDVAQEVLKDFFRVLKPTGRIRIIVPDLEKCCVAFMNRDRDWFSKVDAVRPTAGDGFNQIFYSHFHRYIYDFETLAFALRNAGFSTVTLSSHQQSSDVHLNLDNDSEARQLVSLYVEAVR